MQQPNAFVRFLRHPVTHLLVGIALAGAGLAEVFDQLAEGREAFDKIGAHHGVIVIGVFKILGAAADMIEGLQEATDAG